jgi:hypothetical protein
MKSLGSRTTAFRLALFASVSGNPGPFQTVVRGFSTRRITVDSLPRASKENWKPPADFVANSFEPGRLPVLSIKIVGHADHYPKGGPFEKSVSAQRAGCGHRRAWESLSLRL